MRKFAETTPCPGFIGSHTSRRGHRVSFANDPRDGLETGTFDLDAADSTENITFTTEFRHALIDAKPRRRPAAVGGARREAKFVPERDIWTELGREDDGVQREGVHEHSRKGVGVSAQTVSLTGVLADPRRARRGSAVFEKLSSRPSNVTSLYHAQSASMRHDPAQDAAVRRSSLLKSSLLEPKRSRRLSSLLEEQPKAFDAPSRLRTDGESGMASQAQRRSSVLHKDPRRRTIFIPSDDTTIMTIHPGQFEQRRRDRSPDIGFDLVTLSEEETQPVSPRMPRIDDISSKPRGPRKSLAAKPKRVPLQPSSRSEANVNDVLDVFGQGGGKENIPPGLRLEKDRTMLLDVKCGPADIVVHFDDTVPLTKNHHQPRHDLARGRRESTMPFKSTEQQKRRSGLEPSNGAQLPRLKDGRRSLVPPGRDGIITGSGRRSTIASGLLSHHSGKDANSLADLKLASFKNSARVAGKLPLYYPVISEDLAEPELYEDHWLSRQEIALSQLLGHLLDGRRAGKVDAQATSDKLRPGLLSLYQKSEFVLAHKRLKASLEFGALAIPRDMLAQVARLGSDIGLRRRFVVMWTDAYELTALKSALETVVGREVALPKRLSDSLHGQSEREIEVKKLRRGIERFIEMFLIRHEDALPAPDSASGSIGNIARTVGISHPGSQSQAWAWRRTMLRSLMLILLLDRAKSTDVIHGCLFQKTSERKSSVAVVHALASMLFPSLGDVVRPLAHLDYRLRHVQYPLEEFEYKVDNLATALRDGILLARVVEILLPSLRSRPQSTGDETVTINLPSGEMLQSILSADEKQDWALSQHLKLPCLSRSQRLFNVQISLSALRSSSHGIAGILDRIAPEDIVDGHREKSLGLLWSLVGKFGLEWMVDWPGLKSEINKLQDSDNVNDKLLANESGDGKEGDFEHLLLCWAKAIAHKRGVTVSNFTTSFADGKALEAIVDEYMEHFAIGDELTRSAALSDSSRPAPSKSVSAKLKRIGCSTSFVSLFVSPSSGAAAATSCPIPSKSFTIMTLAYLASRLVPRTAAHRAASLIQRCYRRHLARRTMSRRVLLMRVAANCATVVNTRARVIDAACLLQRSWRNALQRRMDRLNEDVVDIQSLARGWAARLAVNGGDNSNRRADGW